MVKCIGVPVSEFSIETAVVSYSNGYLSREVTAELPQALLYADDLVLMVTSSGDFTTKLRKWQTAIKSEGLRVNMEKQRLCGKAVISKGKLL